MTSKWRCMNPDCEHEIELPVGKLPPAGEVHGKKGVALVGSDWLDLAMICSGEAWLKVP